MNVIQANNPHVMLPKALMCMKERGRSNPSRNGDVLRLEGPTTLVHPNPLQRVVFWPERDANPTFHLIEAIWMLAGRRDVRFPTSFVESFSQFSDDGRTFNGAYGHRWRFHFGRPVGDAGEQRPVDQILTIAQALRKNPDCRRQVLSMWDGHWDLGLQSKDLPCNTHCYVEIDQGHLNLTVCNRSNDLVWGALGSNVVHFSMLAELFALLTEVPVGTYYQMSNNLHLYVDKHEGLMNALAPYSTKVDRDPYLPILGGPEDREATGVVKPTPLGSSREDAEAFLVEADLWCEANGAACAGMRSQFLRRVASPLVEAYRHYQATKGPDRYRGAIAIINAQPESDLDWFVAAREWYARRLAKHLGAV